MINKIFNKPLCKDGTVHINLVDIQEKLDGKGEALNYADAQKLRAIKVGDMVELSDSVIYTVVKTKKTYTKGLHTDKVFEAYSQMGDNKDDIVI